MRDRANPGTTMKRRTLLLSLPALLAACSTLPASRGDSGRFVAREVVVEGATHRYQVFVPAQRAGGRPPVILFLHGAGERGSDNQTQLKAGLGPYLQKHADDFPAIVVLPQVPQGGAWRDANNRAALAALDAATREFGGDPARTYLTGISMGGYGTWEIAAAQPQRFAAIVPVCGAIQPPANPDYTALRVAEVLDAADPYAELAARLRHVPTWIFHGAEDPVVLPGDSRKAYAALKAAGGDVRYTEFPGVDHFSWDPAYNTPELWTWLFAQQRD